MYIIMQNSRSLKEAFDSAMLLRRSYFVKKVSSQSPGLSGVFILKIFILVTEITVAKTKI